MSRLIEAIRRSFSRKQRQSIVQSRARVNLWTGSIRSGKTVASLFRFLLYVAHAPRGGEIVVIGRTRESIARNVFGPLQDPALFGKWTKHIRYTAGAPTARIFGRTVHVLGASDARAEAVLRGLTVAGAYVDEATLVAEAFWTQLLGRMSVPGAQLFATTNPDGPAHWMKKQVVDRAEELGYRVFHFTLDDNDHLDPEYIAQIKREYVGLWYRRFILGEWVQAAGAIYDMWDPARHVVAHADIPKMSKVLALGIDYGDTHFTRGYLVGMADGCLWVLDEWAPDAATQPEQSQRLQKWLAARPEWAPEWVAVDSAAASFRNQLSHDGVDGVRNAHKSVLPGIRTVAGLFATDRLKVSDRCVQLIERLPGYVWDDKATDRGKDEPLKEADDEVDALRYAIYTTRLDWVPFIPLAPAEPGAPGDATD